MVMSEFLSKIRQQGVRVTESQIRHAFKTERLQRPEMDASHRYVFRSVDVQAAVEFFGGKASQLETAGCR